jgi:hypothetical protein
MAKPTADVGVPVVVQRAFLHPETGEPVNIGDVYRTTAANAADMLSLGHAYKPGPQELAQRDRSNRRDMRARD